MLSRRAMVVISSITSILLVLILGTALGSEKVLEIAVTKASQAPKIDGKLDD